MSRKNRSLFDFAKRLFSRNSKSRGVQRQAWHQRVGYVEPIVTQPMCIACHGETLSPAVADAIGRLYPEDRATGFAAGDLRGVFWVEFTP